MGLDQYLYIQDCSEYDTESFESADWNRIDNPNSSQPNTWRNFWELHEALELFWEEKKKPQLFGSTHEEFNCVFVEITADELEKIFRSIDSDFDTLISIDYEDEDNVELPDIAYWRQHNHAVLEQMRDNPHQTMLYKSWH